MLKIVKENVNLWWGCGIVRKSWKWKTNLNLFNPQKVFKLTNFLSLAFKILFEILKKQSIKMSISRTHDA